MVEQKEKRVSVMTTAGQLLKTALVATLISVVVSVAVNLIRADGLSFMAEEEYEILVPCPEPGGEVFPLSPTDPSLKSDDTFIVDARLKSEYAKWRFRDAKNLTFDYLDPVPKADLEALAKDIAKSGAKKVTVYGDGSVPDTGEQLGKELSASGIKNIYFVKGGAPALTNIKEEHP